MDITVKNFQSSIPVSISKIKSAARKVVVELNGRGLINQTPTDISIVFVGSRRMRTINKKYLGHDYVTDVITFSLGGETPPLRKGSVGAGLPGPMAEIIICPKIAKQNAKAYGVPVAQELLLYVIHGLLHLAGYDDHTPQDIKQMRLKEKELLEKLI